MTKQAAKHFEIAAVDKVKRGKGMPEEIMSLAEFLKTAVEEYTNNHGL